MARINKSALTKIEIATEATKQFLEKGYSNTTVSAIAKALEMSQGNLTFYYPTKEHLLAELVDILCDYQWQMMKDEANDGVSLIMAVCLELSAMTCACEDDKVFKDFFISAYTSPMCLGIIRRNDAKRSKEVFGEYCPNWTDEQFTAAEVIVSGIEYATLMAAGDPVPLETRISSALRSILTIFNIPEEVQNTKLGKVFALDYRNAAKRVPANFKKHVAKTNDKTFQAIINGQILRF